MSSDVRGSWRGAEARRLLDIYYEYKRSALASAPGRRRRLGTPEEWAGSLLVIFGARALDKLDEPGAPLLPQRKQIRKLLRRAIESELRAQHGNVTCHACGKSDAPTLEWRSAADGDGDGDGWKWACPLCAETLIGPSS